MIQHHYLRGITSNSNVSGKLARAIRAGLLGLVMVASGPALAQDTEQEEERTGVSSTLISRTNGVR